MNIDTIIADSGSTKTDWLVNGQLRFTTQGINPIHQDDDTILAILMDELLEKNLNTHLSPLKSQISNLKSQINFYGSGVRPDQEERMVQLLATVFPHVEHIEAKSDMLGAARALCGTSPGMACILGTGANSCLYDGHDIIANTPPMGYILGDEGSGAVMGKLFLNALYKNRLSENAKEKFEQRFNITIADVIDRIYRQPMANRWLASLCPYIHEQLDQPAVEQLVVANFRNFITCNLAPYHRTDLLINAVGSVAFFFRAQLEQAAAMEGYQLGTILRSPLDVEPFSANKL